MQYLEKLEASIARVWELYYISRRILFNQIFWRILHEFLSGIASDSGLLEEFWWEEKINFGFGFFQMECCGVHSYKDFNKALEFKKYTNEEGDGQIIPEACCLLEDNSNRNTEQLAKLLFQPKDPNCVSVPTVTNSYMNQVILLYPTTAVDKIICIW